MRTTYEERALKFANFLAKLFYASDCEYWGDFENVLRHYNRTHKRQLCWRCGVSRIAIIRSDYVIKFDYVNTSIWWANGRAGNCETEEEVYNYAVECGMEHLLAKTSVHRECGYTFAIMPKINNVDKDDRYWKYCNFHECNWLENHINDLHKGNFGTYKGKIRVIDYAWGNF